MQRQRLAGFLAEARHDVEDPRRHARLAGELAQADARQRRLLGRLQHHRVAGEQRRTHLPAADDERVVPRHDGGDHAERLAPYQRQVVGAGGRDLVVELVGELCVVLDAVGAVDDIDRHRVDDRLADVARLEQRQAVDVGAHRLREAPQDALALLRLHAPPYAALEAVARRAHRARRRPRRRSAPPAQIERPSIGLTSSNTRPSRAGTARPPMKARPSGLRVAARRSQALRSRSAAAVLTG